ncbi:nuclear pore complex protein Nup205 isoform X3 [Bufo bufo]|uniref:nuclear pore complex protein Nup205 isoform X3 n=1 Tax=Bufo bufo TaxID=8384 RepID=UPI001ABE2BCC|nr:nuclear pore complex protein Nup205 isoform X3 [Bufo bufo]
MAAPLAVNSGASLWGPYKNIWTAVENALLKRQPEAVHVLDLLLKKHKPDLISLFKNPAKSPQQHEKIQKASTEGIAIKGQQGTRLLPEALIKEAFILSDLFNIGEVAAVELLLAGEHQQPHFPGLTRGLVAVLLYWDGKRCIANSLCTLIQSRKGKTFTMDLSPEVESMTTRFTDDLMESGLTQKILTLVSQIDVNNEFDKLQKERGLGNEKHRKEVSDLIKESRQSLAESLFSWACQTPLNKDDTLLLIGYLEKVSVEADGTLDSVNLYLFMALLYCFDVGFLELGTEDRDELMHQTPLLTEKQYVAAIHQRLQDSQPWKLSGLQATVRLAWALALRGISQLTEVTALAEFTEADEVVAEMAVGGSAFLFLTDAVVASEIFSQEEFFFRRIHTLVTDFLTRMPMKVKQLRNRAEEDARLIHMSLQMGNEPPTSLRRDLEHLLLLLGELYKKDPFHLELALEFWCPTEPLQNTTLMGSYLGVAHQRPPQRQVLLSKFVRQMSDLLPPTLYIPYLKMLQGLATGPQCAHYCFSFLKANGSSHENLQAGSPVSWDHFFHSLMLYYEHLRKDVPSSDIVHQRHPPLRGITQREMDGLVAFLQLTTTVIDGSESARLALCEHSQWTPVIVILGLLQCSIPPVLKAELLKTLTAFGKSPEIAASLWQSLEHTQILQTVRRTGQRQVAGIEVELNEIESRAEEYPLTRAFCNLIGTLVESYFPSNLGAGLRPPGFEPYLQFLRDTVFLRFRTRAYRRAAEKWEVAEAVLDVFYKLLRDYEPQPEDFVEQYVEMQGEEKAAYKPPGFSLMHHLLNESPMLELCLSLLEEGVTQLDTYAPFPGKKHLEKAVTCCFMLLNLTLQKENLFMDLLRESHIPLIVTPLEQLLQGINPRSKKADHVVNIARYLYHGSSNPELAFESAKILCKISSNANIQAKLVGDFTQDPKVSQKLMAGFVECLDSEESEEVANPLEEMEEERKLVTVHHETKIHILNLLITSLEMKPPNLALYLLGFELKKPVSTTNLQDSGVLGFPRTCLHSILDILKNGTDGRQGPVAVLEAPHLAELCYQVIHQLCACADTSGPTMRYLRTSQDFLVTQLHHLPFSVKAHEISALNQMLWLMKTLSIELRVTSLNRQRSHTQRLLNLLLDDVPVRPYIVADGESGMEEDNRNVYTFLHFDTSSKVRRKILSILDSINFTQEIPEQLQLDYFDRIQIEQVITNCEHKDRNGQTVCNVKLLHRVLVAEVNALQGMAAIGQRPLMFEEINTILQYAVERNKMFQCLHAKRHALESWRQLVEIILTACPQDLIPAEQRQLIIRDLLQDLHDKILDDEATKDLMPVVAGAVFTLTVHLSQSIRTEQKQPLSALGVKQSQYVLLLDGSFAAPPGTDTLSAGFASIGDSSLHMILRKLLEFILKTGGGLQRVRAHLYGALLYYLQIAQRPDEPDTLEAANKTMWERLTAPEDVFSKLQRDNLNIFESYGAALMEVICRDSCDGREIGRMLALALLDRIVCVDKQQQWLVYLCNSGYLQALVDSLAQDDVILQNLLNPQPPLLKALYIYESKMAFLTRVAKGQQGALELLRSGVIIRLAQCQVYGMRPDTDQHGVYGMRDTPVFIPAPLERYRQILLPALQLCQVILTSSTAQHLQVAGQVLQFLIAHSDTIHAILRSKEGSLGSLQELALLTGIISKAALPEVVNDLGSVLNEGPMIELHGHVGRFQRLCLSLLNRFGGSDKLRQLSLQDDGPYEDGVSKKDDMELAMQQICSNVMEYCHTLMLQNSPNLQQMVCLFTPSLSESGSSRDTSRLENQASLFPSWRLPSLGIVLSLLKQCSSDFFTYYDIHRQSVGKLQNVEQLPPDEIKELCQSETPVGVDKISTTQKHLLARRRLVKLINSRAKLLSVCCYIIETCLFILWRHLEYYLLQCTPSDGQDSLFSNASFTSRRFQDTLNGERNADLRTTNKLSQQDMEMLQREGANLFGESLQKRLLDIESMYCKVRSRHSFIQALLRRIRGLLRVSRA